MASLLETLAVCLTLFQSLLTSTKHFRPTPNVVGLHRLSSSFHLQPHDIFPCLLQSLHRFLSPRSLSLFSNQNQSYDLTIWKWEVSSNKFEWGVCASMYLCIQYKPRHILLVLFHSIWAFQMNIILAAINRILRIFKGTLGHGSFSQVKRIIRDKDVNWVEN